MIYMIQDRMPHADLITDRCIKKEELICACFDLATAYNGIRDFVEILNRIYEGIYSVSAVTIAGLILTEALDGYFIKEGKRKRAKYIRVNDCDIVLGTDGDIFINADIRNGEFECDNGIRYLLKTQSEIRAQKMQEKEMEIGRANSQPPEDDKTYNKDSLPSSTVFCNPEQDIENPSSRFEFTQLLKALREQKGVTQQQVSEATGISKSAYVNYECGNRKPGFSSLIILADYFNVSADTLLGRSNG